MTMDYLTNLLKDSERVQIHRRHLLQTLGLTVTAAFATGILPKSVSAIGAGPLQSEGQAMSFPVTTVNHLDIQVTQPMWAKTRDFFADLVGLRVVWSDSMLEQSQLDCGPEDTPNSLYIKSGPPGNKPSCTHIALGLPDFYKHKDALLKEIKRRGFVETEGGMLQAGTMVAAPSGWGVQQTAIKDKKMFPGAHVCGEDVQYWWTPSGKAGAVCTRAYEAGLKDLGSIPKPSGRGFAATHFKYIVIHVPDIGKESEFYTSFLGMKVVSKKADEVSLRFGQNTLVLRPAEVPGKPTCHEFGFVVQDYNDAKVKAELDRRGLSPKKSSFGGWVFNDPNGLAVEIAGDA